jgi:hypothetical protein
MTPLYGVVSIATAKCAFALDRNALGTGFRSPSRPASDEFAHIKADPKVRSSWCLTAVTIANISKNRLRLHSADRRTTGFLQVAPIETASARPVNFSSAFISEALPIGR